MRPINRTIVLAILVGGVGTWSGCGDGGGSGPGNSAGLSNGSGSTWIIDLDGAAYLLKTSQASIYPDRTSGLVAPGDIDADGVPDLVVALNRKKASAPAEQTWIEAYSGTSGKQLWSLQGKYDHDPAVSYQLGPIAVVGDVDGDAVRDIYCLEAYARRSAFLISGRTGTVIGRYPVERRAEFGLPQRCQDYNADGTADLWFSRNAKSLAITICSGKDLSRLEQRTDVWETASVREVQWVVATYHDDNSDGVPDVLLRRYQQANFEYAIVDGKSLAILRTFESPQPPVGAATFFAAVGDLDGDRIGDLVFSSRAGGGPQGRQTLLRAISGQSGAVIWDVAGGQFGAGAKGWSVDTRTGKKTQLVPDVGFGHSVITAPDMNGDGVEDLAVVTEAGDPKTTRPAILVISGKSGELLSTLVVDPTHGLLRRPSQMIRLRPNSEPNSLTLAVAVRSPDSKTAVAILVAD